MFFGTATNYLTHPMEKANHLWGRTRVLLESVRGIHWRKVYLAMFTVYIDDSGTAPEQKVAIASAFVIPARQINALEREWENLKKKERFSDFHTSEMVYRNPRSEFANWDSEKQQRVFHRVREISKKYGVGPSGAVSFSINKADHDAIVPNFLRSELGNHYTAAVRQLTTMVDGWRLSKKLPPLEYVFDWMGERNDPRRIEIETAMQQSDRYTDVFHGRKGDFSNYSFRRRTDIPGLQCVDAIGWTCYQQALLTFSDKPMHPLAKIAWRDYGGELGPQGWLQAFMIIQDKLREWVSDECKMLESIRLLKELKAKNSQQIEEYGGWHSL
jgi:hypothetical protein